MNHKIKVYTEKYKKSFIKYYIHDYKSSHAQRLKHERKLLWQIPKNSRPGRCNN